MKVALVQEAPVVGDIAGNTERLAAAVARAASAGADLAVSTELALTAYPPRDLLERPDFVDANLRALAELARRVAIPTIVGACDRAITRDGPRLFNAAAVLEDGAVRALYHKRLLPDYDVFDESRYFTPGAAGDEVVTIAGVRVGLSVCEDIWNDAAFWPHRRYERDPIDEARKAGARLLVNLSASPFSLGKRQLRRDMLAAQARKHGLPLVVVNQVGAHDDLIFDGGSAVYAADGTVGARCRDFATDLVVADVDLESGTARGERREHRDTDPAGEIAAAHDALVLGIRDYAAKCGFQSAVLGLSGGIDSAVTAALAAEALGADNVHGVALPSRHSSDHSLRDARALADNLGLRFATIPIAGPVEALETALAPSFAGLPAGVAEENLQARARGVLLMGLSNKHGHLLLSTGNKSEVAVGYATLYGDMCGGLAVLADLFKTSVYELAHEINRRAGRALIPESSITKPPSAELRPDQTDQDTLPPYEVLDAILERAVERLEPRDAIVGAGFDAATVDRVLGLVARAEYKRYQLPPALKVTFKAFGPGRRMPLAARTPR